jgi:hypothetical protein
MAIAPIAKQLDEVLEKLAALPDETKADVVVDIRRRLAGLPAAAGPQSPAV